MPESAGGGTAGAGARQPMDNPTTAHEILTYLEGRLGKCKRTGDKLMAQCPAHEDKTPSLSVEIGDTGDRVVMHCFARCTTNAVLDKLGMTMPELFATDNAWRSHNELPSYEWTDYATGETVTQTRPGGDSKYLVPKGTKIGTLAYPARYDPDATRPIIWCEGAKAATAAASKLPADDYDVVGFFSASTIPNGAILAEIAKGRPCIVWPDDDKPGAKVGRRLVSALRQAGAAEVTIVDPELLGLTGARGHDAAEWTPGKDPKGDFEAACRTAQPITKSHRFKLVWDIEAQPDPRAVVPGLLYEGYQTVIEAGPKWGKTTLIVDAVAAAYASGEWLGESCDEPGPILWISEMAEPLIRAWLARRLPEGVKPNIYVSPICGLNELAAAVEEIHPCAVIVDSFIAAFRTDRPNAGKPDEWRAGDVREFFTRLRDICPTSLTTNHVRKSDGAGRDSGDLHAAVDLLIELRDEDSNRHYTAPELSDRRRTLHYAGRILHGRVAHCQMGDDFGFTVVDGHGTPSTGGGGEVDPFTVADPVDPLDTKINGFLMRHPEGVTQKAVRGAVRGARVATLVDRLKAVGTLGTDKLWRCATQPGAAAKPSRITVPQEDGTRTPEQAVPDALPPPVGNTGTGGAVPAVPVNGNKGGTGTGTGSGTGSHPIGEPPTGTGSGNRFREPDLLALAGAKTTTAPTPRGGSVIEDTPIGGSIPVPDVHTIREDQRESFDSHDQKNPKQSTPSDPPRESFDSHPPRPDRALPAPEVHSSGTKKWDDATGTWVPDDDCFTVGPTKVSLSDGLTVTDGDPSVHKPSRWTGEQWSTWENMGMVH